MGAILQALYLPGVIAHFAAGESLERNAKVAAGEPGILIMGIVVIKPLKSLSSFS
jgi:hypothetical protein